MNIIPLPKLSADQGNKALEAYVHTELDLQLEKMKTQNAVLKEVLQKFNPDF